MSSFLSPLLNLTISVAWKRENWKKLDVFSGYLEGCIFIASTFWSMCILLAGEENGIFDIISQINGSGDGTEVNWKTAYGDLLSSLKNRNARCEEG